MDLFKQILTVGKSKTAEGAGESESVRFPEGLHPPSRSDPANLQIQDGRNAICPKTKVEVRFYDLRQTRITKLAESGAGDESLAVVN